MVQKTHTHQYNAECACGTVKVTATFSKPIEAIEPRECDCDFCVANGLAYLSDVDGSISISQRDSLKQLKQGSEQATFWQCRQCDQVLAVTHSMNGELKGALSKTLFEDNFDLKPCVVVSPKRLPPEEKPIRWQSVWSSVRLHSGPDDISSSTRFIAKRKG